MFDEESVDLIRQRYFGDHWKVGTIASELSLHPDTVRRAIDSVAFSRARTEARARRVDPYLERIEEILREHPRLRATRIFQMVRARGFTGSVVTLRRAVRALRPVAMREAYLRLRTLPGEQAQVDWASFGKVQIGKAQRRLCCFVMGLSHSRALFVEFFLGDDFAAFLTGHVHAFSYFCGVARTVLHDSLKSAVIARRGALVSFNPRYLELCGHYCFAAQACRPRRANEKGRVEKAIAYVRSSFFAARSFHSLTDLNAQVRRWMDEVAAQRRWPDDPRRTVGELLAEEQPRLHPLPQQPPPVAVPLAVCARKTIYVRFDGNDYSIPPDKVGRPLTLLTDPTTVRLLDGTAEVARHVRSYDRWARIEDPRHTAALLAIKRRALAATTPSVLVQELPEVEAFLSAAFEKGEVPGRVTRELVTLRTLYGALALRAALVAAMDRRTPRMASVRFLLERNRRQHPQPKSVELADRHELAELFVKPHDLEDYDDERDDSDPS